MEAIGPDAEISGLSRLGGWATFAEASEHALVVLAMGRECWIMEDAGVFSIHADPGDEDAILREFALYGQEQAEARIVPRRVEFRTFSAGLEMPLLWAGLLLTVFLLQGNDPTLTDRFCNSTTALVEHGEWWRPFTALFLHADAGHLLGNVFIGGIFCVLVAQSVGAWRGWLWILAGGTLANALNAWLHRPGPFQSIGASTATFAALGILVGVTTRIAWATRSYQGFKPLLLPAIAGFILLGWFGSGGENTDVAGHFLGALCGMALAMLFARPEPLPDPDERGVRK
jgi:rhomboid protease GluP